MCKRLPDESFEAYKLRRKEWNKLGKPIPKVLWHSRQLEAQEDGTLKLGRGISYIRDKHGELV